MDWRCTYCSNKVSRYVHYKVLLTIWQTRLCISRYPPLIIQYQRCIIIWFSLPVCAFRVYPLIIMWILLLSVMASCSKLYFPLFEDPYFLHTQVKDETITRTRISIRSPRRSKILIHNIFLYFCSQFVPHWFVCSVRQCNNVMYSPNVTWDVCVLYLCTLLLNCYLLLLKLLMAKSLSSIELITQAA